MGSPELAADPRFRSFADRLAHREELLEIVGEIMGTRTTDDWLGALRGRVPCAPVNTVRQALADPQVRARDMIVEVEHPVWGRLEETGSPFLAGAERAHSPAPTLGQDTDAILSDLLGYAPEEIAALRSAGAV
jgi:crotonobetainyl-CoA:carnitine CoA-transferase CaiB-like acyl-CoA transferase